jgi:hypothetical protein
MNARTVATLSALAVLTLAGCSTDPPSSFQSGQSATSAPATTLPTVEPSSTGIARVGPNFWFTYPNGLQVQISNLHKFTIDANAITGTPGAQGVAAQVTVRNNTGKTFDVSGTEVSASWGPDGYPATEVWDGTTQGSFRGTIPAGRARTSVFGFEIPRAGIGGPIDVEVKPANIPSNPVDMQYDSAQFEGVAD